MTGAKPATFNQEFHHFTFNDGVFEVPLSGRVN
jgi:hypothetical protein